MREGWKGGWRVEAQQSAAQGCACGWLLCLLGKQASWSLPAWVCLEVAVEGICICVHGGFAYGCMRASFEYASGAKGCVKG
jgi:hypothetical protein